MRRLLVLAMFSTTLYAGTNVWTTNGPNTATIWDIEYDRANPSVVYATTDGTLLKSTNGGASWVLVSTAPGGTALTSVAIHPTNSSILYVTTERKGIWKTTDAGATWTEVSDGIPSSSSYFTEYVSVTTLEFNPATPSTLYAGTERYGVFKTTDSGANWVQMASLSSRLVSTIAVDPNSTSTVYAATRGDNRVASSSDSVYKSTDSGETWTAVNSGLWAWGSDVSENWDLEIDGSTTPSTLYLAYGAGGLSKSTNGGATWVDANLGTGGTRIIQEAFTVDVAASSPSTVLVGGPEGIFKSTNSGASFIAVNTGLSGAFFGALGVDPTNAQKVVAGNSSDIHTSTNGGSSWSLATGVKGAFLESLTYDAVNGSLFAIGRDTVYRSNDDGASWTRMSDFDGRSAPELTNRGGVLYGITYEGGCRGWIGYGAKLAKSTDGGQNWTFTSLGTAARGVSIAVHPTNANIIYASMTRSLDASEPPIKKSIDGGVTWTDLFTPFNEPKLALHPTNTSIVFAGSGSGVWKSTNGGATWTKKDTDMNGFWYGVTSLAIDPSDPNHIFAGTGVLLFESTDGGEYFTATEVVDLQTVGSYYDELWVTGVVFDAHVANTVYLSTRRYGVFRSTDGGTTWSPFNNGLIDTRVNDFVRGANGSLHVATEGGGVFSLDFNVPQVAPVLTATATASATSVSLIWTYAGTGTQFEVQRRSGSGDFATLTTVTGLSYSDTSATADTTYVYRVRATGATTFSNADHATTVAFSDDPLAAGVTVLKAAHVLQLRTAVQAMRASTGLAAASFTDTSLTGVAAKALHFTELRDALTPALAALGQAASFTGAIAPGGSILAVHVQELRTAVK